MSSGDILLEYFPKDVCEIIISYTKDRILVYLSNNDRGYIPFLNIIEVEEFIKDMYIIEGEEELFIEEEGLSAKSSNDEFRYYLNICEYFFCGILNKITHKYIIIALLYDDLYGVEHFIIQTNDPKGEILKIFNSQNEEIKIEDIKIDYDINYPGNIRLIDANKEYPKFFRDMKNGSENENYSFIYVMEKLI